MTKPKRASGTGAVLFGNPQRISLSATALEEIAVTLGVVTPQEKKQLKAVLEKYAVIFVIARKEIDHGPSPAQVLGELRKLSQCCMALETAIVELSGTAWNALASAGHERKDITVPVKDVIDRAGALRNDADQAARLIKGRESRGIRESQARRAQIPYFFDVFARFYRAEESGVIAPHRKDGRGRPRDAVMNAAVSFFIQSFRGFYQEEVSEKWLRGYAPLKTLIREFEAR